MNYVIWKNQDSRNIKGLIISELPPISKPKMKVQETKIDGVDGSIIEELGYETYDKTITIGLKGDFDINEVIKYFSGTGEVVFSNESDKYYKATIIDQIDYERLLRYKIASIKFKVQPFKYSATEQPIEIEVEENPINLSVINNGFQKSKPIITLGGSGTITFYMDEIQIFQYTFDDSEQVVIDSDKQDAYLGNVLKNRNMLGEFPIFNVGNNEVLVEGEVSYIKIENRSRWL